MRPGAAGTTAGGPPFVPGQRPPVFSCDASAQPDELPLPRLSRTQLENTLRFAIRLAVPNEESAIWTKASPHFARYPADQRTPAPGDLKGGYTRIDQSIQQTQIDAMYATATSIAEGAHREPSPPRGDDGRLRDRRRLPPTTARASKRSSARGARGSCAHRSAPSMSPTTPATPAARR